MPLTSTDLHGRSALARGHVLRWDRLGLIVLALVLWAIVVYAAGALTFGIARFL